MTFPITSSRFFGFLIKIAIFRAKILKNHDFRAKNGAFQIDEKVSDSPKNRDFVKIEFGVIFRVKSSAEQDASIRKLKFRRFLVDSDTFRDHIFTKKRDFGYFEAFGEFSVFLFQNGVGVGAHKSPKKRKIAEIIRITPKVPRKITIRVPN